MEGVWRQGKREIIYLSLQGKREIIDLSLHCPHQNDSCIKTGSDERHINVLLIVRDKVSPQTTTFKEKREPKHGPIIIPAGGTYYPIGTFPANSERLIGISDAFSALVYGYPSSCPRAHCTPNKSVPTLRYTCRHGPVYIYTGPCP